MNAKTICGVCSLVVGVLTGVFAVAYPILLLVSGMSSAFHNPGEWDGSPALFKGITWTSFGVSVAGILVGAIGFARKDRKNWFATLGIIANFISLLLLSFFVYFFNYFGK
jgi:hypothetical protein